MEYKLHKGYIMGPGYQNPAYGIYETDIFRGKADVEAGSVHHTSESDWEAEQWLDREEAYGTATQADVDELNQRVRVAAAYPGYIMEKVRQHLGLEPWDTSRDDEINNMTHSSVFEHCLVWEGMVGYAYQVKSWVEDIFGVTLD